MKNPHQTSAKILELFQCLNMNVLIQNVAFWIDLYLDKNRVGAMKFHKEFTPNFAKNDEIYLLDNFCILN